MATSRIQDSISCSLCYEQYNLSDRLPKVLPCQHTFCLFCLTAMNHKKSHILTCPMCRKDVILQRKGDMSSLPTNLAVQNIVEEFQKCSSDELKCEAHNDKSSILVCIDCLQGMCMHCVKQLAKGPHKEHEVEDLEDAKEILRKKYNQRILDRVSELQERSVLGLDEFIDESCEEELDDLGDKAINAINDWKNDFFNKFSKKKAQMVDSHIENKICEINKEMERLEMADVSLDEIVDLLKNSNKFADSEQSVESECTMEDINALVEFIRERLTEWYNAKRGDQAEGQKQSQKNEMINKSSNPQTSYISEYSDEEDQASQNSDLLRIYPHLKPFFVREKSFDFRDDDDDDDDVDDDDVDVFDIISSPSPPVHCFSGYIHARELTTEERYMQNIENRGRNLHYDHVVHDRRFGNDKLICETDDFYFLFNSRSKQGELVGKWEKEKGFHRAAKFLNIWDDVLNNPAYEDDISNAVKCMKRKLNQVRNGKIKFKFDD